MKKKIWSILLSVIMILTLIPSTAFAAGMATVTFHGVSYTKDPATGKLAGTQSFTITNNTGCLAEYEVVNADTGKTVEGPAAFTGTKQITLPIDNYYTVYVDTYDEEENYVDTAYQDSVLEHTYTVNYILTDEAGNTKTVTIETGKIEKGGSIEWTADDIYTDGSMVYDLQAGQNATQYVIYGTPEYTFSYTEHLESPETANVFFVDERGNDLEQRSFEVAFKGETVYSDIPEKLTVGNKTYTKKSNQPSSIKANFYSPVLDFEIVYQPDVKESEKPYSVEVRYVDEATNAFLGHDYFSVLDGDDTVEFTVPSTLQITSAGTVTYYDTAEKSISHQADSTDRVYQVKYKAFDKQSPYDWSIRLVDSVNGALLGTDTITVGVDEIQTYEADSKLEAGGKEYLLDSAMSKTFEHVYGEGSRIQYIYYNEVGAVVESAQTLSVMFRNVTDNSVLYTETLTAEPESTTVISSPEVYEANDKEYVRLNGQTDEIVHDYGSVRRTYTVYYRDSSDLQNLDTEVVEEEVVTSENIIENIIYDDAAGETLTTLTNEETGTAETLTEDGTPVADAREDAGTQIPDEDTPLANQDLENNEGTDDPQDVNQPESTNDGETTIEDEETPLANKNLEESKGMNPLMVGGITAGILVILAGILAFLKKRKENR